jgi:hypothetical protein
MDEHTPDTQPSGELTPPPRHPPTALATSAPLPPNPRSANRMPLQRRGLRGVVEAVLDRLDTFADRIADAAGIR